MAYSAGKPIAVNSDANPYSFLISATASTRTFSPVKRGSKRIRKKQQSFGDMNQGSIASGTESERERENTSSPIPLENELLSTSPPQNPFKDIVKSDSQEI